MVMAVHAIGGSMVETPELVELSSDNILKRTTEPRIVHGLSEAMSFQIFRYLLLVTQKPSRANGCGKETRQIEVKPNVNLGLIGQPGRPLGICHEYHCAHRGNRLTKCAIQCSIRGFAIPPPIICIDNEDTRLRRSTVLTFYVFCGCHYACRFHF